MNYKPYSSHILKYFLPTLCVDEMTKNHHNPIPSRFIPPWIVLLWVFICPAAKRQSMPPAARTEGI